MAPERGHGWRRDRRSGANPSPAMGRGRWIGTALGAAAGASLRRAGAALALAASLGATAAPAAQAPVTDVQLIERAQRSIEGTDSQSVPLPDEIRAASGADTVRASYRVDVDLGPEPRRLAFWASGIVGAARVRLNGEVLYDAIAEPLPPTGRGLALLRLVDLPDALLRPGENRLDVEVANRRVASLSVLRIGDRDTLHALHERKAFAMVYGPAIVATVIGCLGAAMLALWLRRRATPGGGLFGPGALGWAAHTVWTLWPHRFLPAPHEAVWWTTLYAAFVLPLALFCLRFAQRLQPWMVRAAVAYGVATPLALYGGAALDALPLVADAVRLGLVAGVVLALGAVAHHAWHRRRLDSALLVAAGLAGAGFGLRDWIVFRASSDNVPVPLTPYSGLPFIVLVSWILIDRFARAAERLEASNRRLGDEVTRQDAALGASVQRLAALESAQSANDERQRLMRSLHDGVGAKLFHALERVEQDALDRDGVAHELRACLADMRIAMDTLRPGVTDLGEAVGNFLFRWRAPLVEACVQPRWAIELPEAGVRLAPHTALQLLRVMQEALTNVLRHAQASRVTLHLSSDGTRLALQVEDDGVGLGTPATASGRGLESARLRAASIGARLSIGAAPGGGTRVGLEMPLAPEPAPI